MRWLVLAACLVIACSDGRTGLLLEVRAAAPTIHEVELWVGQACEGDCPGAITPPNSAKLEAGLFVMHDERRLGGTFEHGRIRFLIASEHDTIVSVLAAVGYGEDGQPVATAMLFDVPIAAGDRDHRSVTLAPAEPLVAVGRDGPPPPDGARRVAHWRTSDPDLPSCVVLEAWTGGDAKRIALGPSADTDCDEVAAPECAPWAYQGVGSPGGDDAKACTRPISGERACMLGATTCSDLAGTTCGVAPETFCLAPTLCACPAWDEACVTMELDANAAESVAVKCAVFFTEEGDACTDPSPLGELDFGRLLPANTTAACTSIELGSVTSFGPFDTSVPVNAGSLEVASFDAATCTAELAWHGSGPQGARTAVALVSVELDTGNHLVVPIALALEPANCVSTNPSRCVLGVPDTNPLAFCTAPTPSPGQCLDVTGTCPSGPLCGDTCCQTGERCLPDGTCSCGALGARCGTGSECAALLPGNQGPCGDLCCGAPGEPSCVF